MRTPRLKIASLTPDHVTLIPNPHQMFPGMNFKVQFKSADSKYEGLFVLGYGRNTLKPHYMVRLNG